MRLTRARGRKQGTTFLPLTFPVLGTFCGPSQGFAGPVTGFSRSRCGPGATSVTASGDDANIVRSVGSPTRSLGPWSRQTYRPKIRSNLFAVRWGIAPRRALHLVRESAAFATGLHHLPARWLDQSSATPCYRVPESGEPNAARAARRARFASRIESVRCWCGRPLASRARLFWS